MDILSISYDAFEILKNGGDTKAIKSTSIIQRTLKGAGINDDVIRFCTSCKSKWDIWVLNNRHILNLDFLTINEIIETHIDKLLDEKYKFKVEELNDQVTVILNELDNKKLLYDLTEDLILGGLFSSIVRRKS